jgi:hypothetical protein
MIYTPVGQPRALYLGQTSIEQLVSSTNALYVMIELHMTTFI